MTISLRATRSFVTNDVSLDGPVTITQGTTNNYNITDYNRFSTYTATASVGTVSISGAVVTLVVPTTTATQIKLSVTKDNTVSNFNIAVGATAIITPAITSPTEGSVNVNVSPTLASTPFTTAPVGADTHQSSQWQVSTNSAFTAIVYDSGTTTVNKTSINVPALALNTVHYARVRYTGATLGTSTWSATRTFTTTNQYVATPSVSTTGSTAAVGGSPTFTGSPFSPVNGSDTHSATDWIVTKISDSSVVYQSIGDTVNKTSITVPSGLLQINTQYRIQVRYAGASFGYSGYGQLDFTTASKFSYEKYLAALIANGTQVKVFGQDVDAFSLLPTLPAMTEGAASGTSSQSPGAVVFSPNGNHLIAAKSKQTSLTVYKRNGDSFNILPSTPISQPSGAISSLSYSADSNYMLVGAGTNAVLYQVTGDTYNRLADPTGQPNSTTYATALSPDGTYFAIGKAGSVAGSTTTYPSLFIYKRVGTMINLLQSVRIGTVVQACRFSLDGNYLVLGSTGAGLVLMTRAGDSFSITGTIPSSGTAGGDFAWSPDSTQILYSNGIYKKNADNTITLQYGVAGTSPSSGTWSADGQYVAVPDGNGPQFIHVSKLVEGSFVETPFTIPSGFSTPVSTRFWPGYQG